MEKMLNDVEPLVLTEEEQPFWDEQFQSSLLRLQGTAQGTLVGPQTNRERAAEEADISVRLRRKRQGVAVELATDDPTTSELVITEVRYGRTIELGEFGRGRRHKKVWFGWTAEVQDGQTEEEVMELLHEKADEQEGREQELFDEEVEDER